MFELRRVASSLASGFVTLLVQSVGPVWSFIRELTDAGAWVLEASDLCSNYASLQVRIESRVSIVFGSPLPFAGEGLSICY